ncbi:hypothetical protein CF319_g4788 [Tilletia indica]|uniref:Uncharacterized protein n=1 Tax=Tilletia indica TaxID=43049 RepID=A0A177TQQ4_9BASI|nr:hypothetical protein CF319_g4788 [Tilletia indica]KAE8233347.1 hypothetical protein CF326_g1620 [Tilletia indica]KAE8254421.1 hypothetical protein A4X13_0g3419 [Tilletia indica]
MRLVSLLTIITASILLLNRSADGKPHLPHQDALTSRGDPGGCKAKCLYDHNFQDCVQGCTFCTGRRQQGWLPYYVTGHPPNCANPKIAPQDGVSEHLCRNAQELCCNPKGGGCCPFNAESNCWWNSPKWH